MMLLRKQEEIVQVVAVLNMSYAEFEKYKTVGNFIENISYKKFTSKL